jgi:GNAT superfamily N-acetyltransferase
MKFHRNLSKNFEPADDAESVWGEFVRNRLNENDFLLIVAEFVLNANKELRSKRSVDDKIIGYCSAFIQSNTPVFRIKKYGVIGDIFVEEGFRGRGIGRKLFGFARRWFEQRGVENLQVSAAHHNLVAQEFWRAMGFTNYLDRLSCEI